MIVLIPVYKSLQSLTDIHFRPEGIVRLERRGVGIGDGNVAGLHGDQLAVRGKVIIRGQQIGADQFFLTEDCGTLSEALQDAVWNAKVMDHDERLDDGSTDIDTLDAFEYTIERDAYSNRAKAGGGRV